MRYYHKLYAFFYHRTSGKVIVKFVVVVYVCVVVLFVAAYHAYVISRCVCYAVVSEYASVHAESRYSVKSLVLVIYGRRFTSVYYRYFVISGRRRSEINCHHRAVYVLLERSKSLRSFYRYLYGSVLCRPRYSAAVYRYYRLFVAVCSPYRK